MQFGRYELLGKLAEGGMGEVFRARMLGVEGFQKPIALKRIYPDLGVDDTYRELFIREAKVTADLIHPNIVQVLELGEHDGQLYIAMEYVHGADLGQLIKHLRQQDAALAPDVAAVVGFDVLEALDFAHAFVTPDGERKALIHRDISPQNILIGHATGITKLCDFGVARASTGSADLLDGKLVGKLRYMAPEQARCEPVDARGDLYAVGVVLFEATTGELFLPPMTAAQIREVMALDQAPRLCETAPELPQAFTDMVDRALAVDADNRYQSAEQFRREMERFLAARDPRAARVRLRDLVRLVSEKSSHPWNVPAVSVPHRPTERWTALVSRATSSIALSPFDEGSQVETPVPQPEMSGSSNVADTTPTGPSTQVLLARAALQMSTQVVERFGPPPRAPRVSLVVMGAVAVALVGILLAQLKGSPPIESELGAKVNVAIPEPIPAPPPAPAVDEAEPRVGPVSEPAEPEAETGAPAERPAKEAGGTAEQEVPIRVEAPAKRPDARRPIPNAHNGPQARRPNPTPPPRRQAGRRSDPRGRQKRDIVRQGHGYLDLSVRPWANVEIDGKALAKTAPFAHHKLTAGSHTVVVTGPSGQWRKFVIDISPGKTTRKVLEFR